MDLFLEMKKDGHEEVLFCHDPDSHLRGIIALHSTIRGPGLGGCRMWPYVSFEEAVKDALQLSRAMTYKAAVTGLDHGGAKAVIWGDPKRKKTEGLLLAFGRMVESLGGRYITAEDVGTTVEDMETVRRATRYVTGISPTRGGGGDPSIATACGVLWGMKACMADVFGNESLEGRRIAIQGVGKVGYHLTRLLSREGTSLFVSDIDSSRVERVVREYGVTAVRPDDICCMECDIFSPSALGGVLNEKTISTLHCRIIAGAANNQLQDEKIGNLLHEKGILYAPDYVINAGGLINVAWEWKGYNREKVESHVAQIHETLREVFRVSRREGISPQRAADHMAERMIKAHKKKA